MSSTSLRAQRKTVRKCLATWIPQNKIDRWEKLSERFFTHPEVNACTCWYCDKLKISESNSFIDGCIHLYKHVKNKGVWLWLTMLCESRQFQEIEHQRLKNLGSKEKFYFDESASFFEQISSMKVGLISRSSSLQYFVPTTIFTSIHFGAISKSFSIIWPARFVLKIFFDLNIYLGEKI